MTSSTSSSEPMHPNLPSPAEQRSHFGRLVLRILLPLAIIGTLACLGLDKLMQTKFIAETPSHGAAKLARIQAMDSSEIPIIGSSRALCSYIPDSIGPRFYDYGVNGIGFAVMDIFLRYAYASGGHQPIILNFDYEMFYYQTGDRNSYLPHMDIPGVRELLKKTNYYSLHQEIPGIRYYGTIDAFAKDWLNERLQLTKAINKGAAIDKSLYDAANLSRAIQQRRDSVLHIRPRTQLLDSLYARVQKHTERPFFLVIAPYHPAYTESLDDSTHLWAEPFLRKMDALPQAKVLRWDTKQWPESDFLNTTHVRVDGAIRFSQMLRDSISKGL